MFTSHSFTISSNQWIVCQHSPSLQCKTAFDISTHPAAAAISGFLAIVKRETLYIWEMYINILNIYFLCCRQVFRNSDFILISRHNVNNYLTLVTNFEEYSIRFASPALFFRTVRPLMYVGAHVCISRFSSDFASHTVRRIIVRTTTEKIEFDRGKESRWRNSIT